MRQVWLRARVAGRSDGGLIFGQANHFRRDCRQLYDAVNRLRVPDEPRELKLSLSLRRNPLDIKTQTTAAAPTFESALNRLPYKGVRRFRWIKFKPSCPVTAWHRVEESKDPANARVAVYSSKKMPSRSESGTESRAKK